MAGSISLGAIGGTRIRLHFTLLLFVLLLAALLYRQGGAAAAAGGVLFFALLFLCVLAHEFGHVLAARALGVRTPEIVLLPIGGIARLERIPERPRDELLMALAGPAVSLAIAAVLVLLMGGLPSPGDALSLAGGRALLAQLAYANLTLLVFNLVPAFPMDGGRVLRALLAARLGRGRGTRIAATIGQGAAILLGLVGLLGGSLILVLIAVFVYFAAGAEAGQVRLHEAMLGAPASALMVTGFARLPPDATAHEAADLLVRTSQSDLPLVDPEGRLLGILTRDGHVAGLARHGGTVPAAELMETDVPWVTPAHRFEEIAGGLRAGGPATAVLDPEGRLLGLITRDNLLERLLLREAEARHLHEAAQRHPRPATGAPA